MSGRNQKENTLDGLLAQSEPVKDAYAMLSEKLNGGTHQDIQVARKALIDAIDAALLPVSTEGRLPDAASRQGKAVARAIVQIAEARINEQNGYNR